MTLRLDVNGQPAQVGAIRDMMLSPADAVAHVSRLFPLETGDLIFTGTPAGVGPLQPGDRLVARLDPVMTCEFEVGG
jgi:fumarylpyruvate hydrolase